MRVPPMGYSSTDNVQLVGFQDLSLWGAVDSVIPHTLAFLEVRRLVPE